MKKYTLALAIVALLPIVSAGAYEYTGSQAGYHSARPVAKTNTYKKASTTRRTGGYNNIVTNNFYYGQPAQYYTPNVGNDSDMGYRDSGYRGNAYSGDNHYIAGSYGESRKQTNRSIKSYSSQERKYFLAHPFFQPLKGRVGSVTDVSYARNKFDFNLLNGRVLGLDPNVPSEYNKIIKSGPVALNGKEQTSMFAVKEDLSYGLTDTLALVLMAQYDKTKITFKDWSGGEPADTYSNSGLNLFGIGLQNRFVDNADWIVMGEAFFEHQKDTANTLIGSIKAGYKIDRTTIYGIGRIYYTNLTNGDIYGAYVEAPSGDWMMLSYNTDVKNIFMGEGGIGAFSVLGKYFTLNGELMYGYYDWHNQLNLKGAFGWQPADHFALNLYASTALYDSAKGKTRQYINYDVDPDDVASSVVYTVGDYNIKKYNEWKVGVQAILYF